MFCNKKGTGVTEKLLGGLKIWVRVEKMESTSQKPKNLKGLRVR